VTFFVFRVKRKKEIAKTENRHVPKKIKNRRSFGGFFVSSDIIKRSYHTDKAVDRKDNVGYLRAVVKKYRYMHYKSYNARDQIQRRVFLEAEQREYSYRNSEQGRCVVEYHIRRAHKLKREEKGDPRGGKQGCR